MLQIFRWLFKINQGRIFSYLLDIIKGQIRVIIFRRSIIKNLKSVWKVCRLYFLLVCKHEMWKHLFRVYLGQCDVRNYIHRLDINDFLCAPFPRALLTTLLSFIFKPMLAAGLFVFSQFFITPTRCIYASLNVRIPTSFSLSRTLSKLLLCPPSRRETWLCCVTN